MKFGLISDIHANLPALEAVLAELDAHDVDRIFDAGDLVNYGPFPNEVISLSRERGILSVQGNRDREVCESLCKTEEFRAGMHPLKIKCCEWTDSVLTDDSRAYLKSLKESESVSINSHRLLMTHDRIRPEMPQLRPDTPDTDFEKAAAAVDEDVIVFGHTHLPFFREIAGKIFINTGSVGRPVDGDSRACYVLLKVESEGITAQIKRVDYDVDRTIEALYESGLPNELYLTFKAGIKLDEIIKTLPGSAGILPA